MLPWPVTKTILLLVASNFFMLCAWYLHLRVKLFEGKPFGLKVLLLAVAFSWGIAFFEYLLQVPANRIGKDEARLSFGQLKILQEIITLSVFVPVSMFLLGEPIKQSYLYAAICMGAAAWFIFSDGFATAP
ncbi:MAG: DMT family protein [Pirellulaceae bacterium]